MNIDFLSIRKHELKRLLMKMHPLHPISNHLPLFTCFESYQHKSIHNTKIRIFYPENINNLHNTLDSTFDIDLVLRESDPKLDYELLTITIKFLMHVFP